MKLLAVAAALGFVAFVTCQSVQAQGSAMLEIKPGDIKWGENPALPKGAKAATIRGDPATGAFIARIMLPANYKIAPHSHPNEITLTVLSGTLYYAQGDKFDAKKLKAFPAGSFIVEPAKAPHYQATKGGAVTFQANVSGPRGFDYVDPKDDPRKK